MIKPEQPGEYNQKDWRNEEEWREANSEYHIKINAFWNAYYLREVLKDFVNKDLNN